MKLSATYELRTGYLYVKMSGQVDPQSAEEIFFAWAGIALSQKLFRVLCDFTLVTVRDERAASKLGKFETGKFAAVAAPRRVKVAVLETPQQIIDGRYGENVTAKNGVSVKMTSDLREALEWLDVGVPADVGATAKKGKKRSA
jgi:hypothetical protein